MTLSWKQLVCHGLLNQIEEPELVKYILKIAIKERCAYLSEESREFHSSNVKFCLYYNMLKIMFLRGKEVMIADLATVPMEEKRFAVNYEKVMLEFKKLIQKCRQKRRERRAALNFRQT